MDKIAQSDLSVSSSKIITKKRKFDEQLNDESVPLKRMKANSYYSILTPITNFFSIVSDVVTSTFNRLSSALFPSPPSINDIGNLKNGELFLILTIAPFNSTCY